MKKQNVSRQVLSADMDGTDSYTVHDRANKHRQARKEKAKLKRLYQIVVHHSFKSFEMFESEWNTPYLAYNGELRNRAEMKWWKQSHNAHRQQFKKRAHRHERQAYRALLANQDPEDITAAFRKWYYSDIWEID